MVDRGTDGWLGADDVLQIHQLLAYYGHVLDDRDWGALDEVFTVDAVLDYTRAGATAVLHGLDEVRTFFGDANHPSAHHTTNVVVVRRDGEVRVRSKFFVPYTRETHVPKRWYGGTYEEPIPPHRRTW
jgi:3-phenylpropionate/cinnamic acid dioxygenase small subunit